MSVSKATKDAPLADRGLRVIGPVAEVIAPNLPAQVAGTSVDNFLVALKKVFGNGLKPGDIYTFRNNDIDYRCADAEVVVSTVTPEGIHLLGRKSHTRRSLRWLRLWPYAVMAVVLAAAILLAWKGVDLLRLVTPVT